MRKTFCLTVCLTVLLLSQLGVPIPVKSTFTPPAISKIASEGNPVSEFNAYMKTRRKTFESARQMLTERGVPFDPDLLIDENWRTLLEPIFSRMPEMKKVVYGSGTLKGVIFAHTLILPERVGLAADTVIIARHLVFQGENALSRGPHNISIFPIETYGMLGNAQAMSIPKDKYTVIKSSFLPHPLTSTVRCPPFITTGLPESGDDG